MGQLFGGSQAPSKERFIFRPSGLPRVNHGSDTYAINTSFVIPHTHYTRSVMPELRDYIDLSSNRLSGMGYVFEAIFENPAFKYVPNQGMDLPSSSDIQVTLALIRSIAADLRMFYTPKEHLYLGRILRKLSEYSFGDEWISFTANQLSYLAVSPQASLPVSFFSGRTELTSIAFYNLFVNGYAMHADTEKSNKVLKILDQIGLGTFFMGIGSLMYIMACVVQGAIRLSLPREFCNNPEKYRFLPEARFSINLNMSSLYDDALRYLGDGVDAEICVFLGEDIDPEKSDTFLTNYRANNKNLSPRDAGARYWLKE